MGVLFMAGPMFASPVVDTPDGEVNVPGFKFKIWIVFEIGKRSLPDCPGFGFCRLDFGIENLKSRGDLSVNQVYGEAYFDDNGQFVIECPREYMRGDTEALYFSDKFIVEEDYDLPREVLDKFKHTGEYKIKTGNYPITEKNGRFIMKF